MLLWGSKIFLEFHPKLIQITITPTFQYSSESHWLPERLTCGPAEMTNAKNAAIRTGISESGNARLGDGDYAPG